MPERKEKAEWVGKWQEGVCSQVPGGQNEIPA
jgi:hypothetical protein